ncbi:MAG: hypothetical protein GC162_16020 [Planctomycetes bacterium]|nr:hypothetical protein [Planctomycetota bacterium]
MKTCMKLALLWGSLIWFGTPPQTAIAVDVPVTNGGFETNESIGGLLPSMFGDWDGDASVIVGAENGITPHGGSKMLKFNLTAFNSFGGTSADVITLVDLAPFSADIATGEAVVHAQAFFNRILGTSTTDTEFLVTISAFSGSPSSFPADSGSPLASGNNFIISDGDTSTWEAVDVNLLLPTATTYLALTISAPENISPSGLPELDGHYADDVTLLLSVRSALTPEPTAMIMFAAPMFIMFRRR